MTKNLYLPPDASPERRAAQAGYVAASDRLANGGGEEAMDAYREAERAFGAVLLAEDKIRRPHVYATDREPMVKATSAKEVIAAAILDDARAMGALAGGLPVERRLATAILAALDAAGLVVVPREPTEAMREAARAAPLARGIGYVGIGGIYRAMIAAQEKRG